MREVKLLKQSFIDYVINDGTNPDRYDILEVSSNPSLTRFCAEADLAHKALLRGCFIVTDLINYVSIPGRKPENHEAIGITPKHIASGLGLKLRQGDK